MIDRAKNTDGDIQGAAHPNTPGARKGEKAPDIAEGKRPVAPGSPKVGDKQNDVGEQLSNTPSHHTSGAPDSPKAANRVDNKRSKKLPGS